MKKRLIKLSCLLLLGINLIGQSQSLNLNVPGMLCSEQYLTSGNNKISYTVSELISSCVNIYGSNPGQMAVDMYDGKTSMNPGSSAFVMSTVKLYSVSGEEGQKSYNFGQGCAEDGLDDANVNIVYAGEAATIPSPVTDPKAAYLQVSADQVLSVTGNNTPNGATGQMTYLHVSANDSNTATIKIAQESRQGQVYVVVYSANGGNALAMLHSKSNDLSYTTNQDVYVVPMIRPNVMSDQRSTTIVFEVGDPRRNGKVVAEEEGE